jgi:hypothetical protein
VGDCWSKENLHRTLGTSLTIAIIDDLNMIQLANKKQGESYNNERVNNFTH